MPRRKSPIDPDELKLWRRYARSPTDSNRNALVILHQGLVAEAANKLAQKLKGAVTADELLTDGAFGLLESVQRFKVSRGLLFTTYAGQRIQGAMLDGLRQSDNLSRLTRQQLKAIEAAREELSQKQGQRATDEDTAQQLGVTDARLLDMLKGATSNPCSLSTVTSENDRGDIHNTLGAIQPDRREPPVETPAQKRDLLKLVTKGLNRNERLIIILYYYEGLTMKDIGKTLDLSESRVSQMHSSIVARLKATLSRRVEEFTP